jgi:hypothetical protein
MRRTSLAVLLIGGLTLASASVASAQHGGFGPTTLRLGPVLGFGNIGDAGISWGGRIEKGIKELPNLGNGVLSIEASIDYYSWNGGGSLDGYSWKNIPISGTVNYHINTKSPKWGAFVGAGLGYENWSVDCPSTVGDLCGNYSSGIYFVGRLGGTYAVANTLQIYADAGAGAATISAGVMFLLGKK